MNFDPKCVNGACSLDWKPIRHWSHQDPSEQAMEANISFLKKLMPSQSESELLETRQNLLDKALR
jgi:hypothetical protein